MKSLIRHLNFAILIFIFPLMSQVLPAQPASLSLTSTNACPGELITISLNAQNLVNVGAITLYIGYDTAVLKYEGHANVHPQFPGLMSNAVNQPTTQIVIAWNSLSPGNLSSGKLLDLRFTHKAGSGPVNFNPGGEIVTINLIPVLFSTTNGAVTQLPPYITGHPQNTTVHSGHNAIFTVVATQVDAYQWQQYNGLEWSDLQNSAIYQNVNGPQLTIVGVSGSLNNFRYRCRLTNFEYCMIYSKPANLSVIPGSQWLPQVFTLEGGGTFCEGVVPSGISIALSNSQTGVNYQLYNGPSAYGSVKPGTGSMLVWENVIQGLYMANASNIHGTVNMIGTISVVESPLPEVYCPADTTVSISSAPFDLGGASPEGGEYSGNGVESGIFSPGIAGLGEHIITYTYSDVNNCTNLCEFQITVSSAYLPGDANGDGLINILDVVIVVSYIMGENPEPFIFEAADINGDGIINLQDLVMIINIIMGN